MPSNVINGWRTSAHRRLDRAALVRAPRGWSRCRAARRIDRLPPPTCLDLMTCSDDRLQ